MLTRAEDYTVGWICAISTEYVVACELLDEEYEAPRIDSKRDDNSYTFGLIGEHKVVIACLPKGNYGNTSAALVGERMRQTFSNIRFGLVVGIAGGAPSQKHDIRLGDVVVSSPTSRHGGVIQYDYGKTIQEQAFEETGYLASPPTLILNALAHIIAKHERKGHQIADTVADMLEKNRRLRAKYTRPARETDILCKTAYIHISDGSCHCQKSSEPLSGDRQDNSICVSRQERGADVDDPMVHYGLIASANQLMKDASARDALIKKHDVLCFEMEGAGLMNSFPCVVIRGICDYSDTHKNDTWQGYAATAAAAYAKELLGTIRAAGIEQTEITRSLTEMWLEDKNMPDTMENSANISDRLSQSSILTASVALMAKNSYQATKSYYMIPLLQNRRFVGRESKLAELQQRFLINPETRQLAIFGLGGVGKTQLALAFCYTIKEQYPDYSIYWLSASSSARFKQDYIKLAKTCSLPTNVDDDRLIQQVREYLSSEQAGKWLLVVDNADDKTFAFDGNGIVNSLPEAEAGITLFTTRYKEIAFDIADGNILSLEEMDLEEAKTFLAKSLRRDDLLRDTKVVEELLEELTCLPLAIAQAASYIIKCSITVSQYLALMKDTEEEMIKLLSRDFWDSTRDTRSAVAVTWLVSFEQIKREEPAAADILFFMALLESKSIPLTILPSPGSYGDLIHAIGILVGYSFLSKNGEMYDMHRLVHRAVKIWMQKEGIIDQWKEQTIIYLEDIFPSSEWENRTLWREFMPHTIRALQNTEQMTADMSQRADLCLVLGRCLVEDGRFSEAVKWIKECVSYCNENLAEEDCIRLASQRELGWVYQRNGQMKEAIDMLEKIVAIETRVLAEEDSSRLSSQHALAYVYQSDGRSEEAMHILEKVVAIRTRTLSEEHHNRLASQHVLAETYTSTNRVQEAVEILEKVVVIRERILSEDHPGRLASQHALAKAYQVNGQVEEALELLKRVASIQAKVLTEDHLNLLTTQHNLALTYYYAYQLEEAIELIQHVVNIKKKSMRPDHPELLASKDLLSSLLKKRDAREHSKNLTEWLEGEEEEGEGEDEKEKKSGNESRREEMGEV